MSKCSFILWGSRMDNKAYLVQMNGNGVHGKNPVNGKIPNGTEVTGSGLHRLSGNGSLYPAKGKSRRLRWDVKPSEMANNTLNPIRAIVDGMKLTPNPDKHMIALSIGASSAFGVVTWPSGLLSQTVGRIIKTFPGFFFRLRWSNCFWKPSDRWRGHSGHERRHRLSAIQRLCAVHWWVSQCYKSIGAAFSSCSPTDADWRNGCVLIYLYYFVPHLLFLRVLWQVTRRAARPWPTFTAPQRLHWQQRWPSPPSPIISANFQITICPIAHAESKESAKFTWKHHFGVSALFPSLTGCDFDQRVQSGHWPGNQCSV